MTREEAIKTIEVAIAEVEWEYPIDYAVAFEMAIEALREQETTCHQLTNADRLRGMSDEELARQFGAQCPKESKRPCDKQCNLCWLEWLQQSAADCSECGFEAQHREYRGVQKYCKLCPSCGACMNKEDDK